MRCPFKKITQMYSSEHREEFGFCDPSCMAAFAKADGNLACAFIEKHKLIAIQGENCLNEINKISITQE